MVVGASVMGGEVVVGICIAAVDGAVGCADCAVGESDSESGDQHDASSSANAPITETDAQSARCGSLLEVCSLLTGPTLGVK